MSSMGKEALSTVVARVDALVVSEPLAAKALAKLEALLEAQVVVRGTSRTPGGSPIYEERTDNAVQLAAAVKLLEYRHGKPRQMIEVDTTKPGSATQSLTDLGRLLGRNPDIAAKVLEALKYSQAIEVQAVTSETPPTS